MYNKDAAFSFFIVGLSEDLAKISYILTQQKAYHYLSYLLLPPNLECLHKNVKALAYTPFVQGHSRSPILAPAAKILATPMTVSEMSWIIGRIFAVDC